MSRRPRHGRRRWTATVGQEMRRWRRREGLTHEDLAEHLGVSTSTISHWETGRSGPNVRLIPTLAALGWRDPREASGDPGRLPAVQMLPAAMDEAGHSAVTAATYLGVNNSTIAKWLSGTMPRQTSIDAINDYIRTWAPECWEMLGGNPPPVEIRSQGKQQTLNPPQQRDDVNKLLERATTCTREVEAASERVAIAERALAEAKQHHAGMVAKLDATLAQLKGAL